MTRAALAMRHNAPFMRIPLFIVLGLAASAAACGAQPVTQREQVKRVFDAADLDHDEQLDPEEFATLPLRGVAFEELDSDGNHRVSLAELLSFLVYQRVKDDGNRAIQELIGPRRR